MDTAEKWKRAFDIKSAATRKFQPCPGHMGKVDNDRDGCPWCRIETLERKLAAKDIPVTRVESPPFVFDER